MSTEDNPPRDDLLIIEDAESSPPAGPTGRTWRILVVDDDDDIHETTRFALAKATILDRPLELIHARSAAEARERVAETDDIAVALIDVVMETPDAGLVLVRDLRESGLTNTRIVLRTGQPGYAPELSVISSYEIDDYRTKSELTQVRLLTVLTAGIRAYDQVCTIRHSRAGLEMIVESSTKLFQRTNLELFSRGVLTQIASLLRIAPHGVVGVNGPDAESAADAAIVCALGRFEACTGNTFGSLPGDEIASVVADIDKQGMPVLRNGYMALHLSCDDERNLWIVMEADNEISPQDLTLLKLFSTNITIGFENLALLEKLDRLAYVDPVLDMPNLNAIEKALRERLENGIGGGRLALMTVDALQSVVADYGPRIANHLLEEVYRTLSRHGGDDLVVARVGDATFALLGDRETLQDGVIPAAFARPFQIDGIEIATKATSAIIDLADTEPDPAAIMRVANAALLHVDRTQRGKCMSYDTALRAAIERRHMLRDALKESIEKGDGFAVHLQPKVNTVSGDVIGAEALLRWNYGGEPVSPAEFIPIAESGGMTQELTEFLVKSIGRWSTARSGLDSLPVAVNLSMTDLNNPGFAARLLSVISDTGLSPDTIEFEVTEGIAMQDTPWPIEQVRALKSAGFRIALDDFGTGYSSLGNFDRLPIDTLKIDRRFITPLNVHTARNSLAAVVVAMTQMLNVDCVAEGIETPEQNQALVFLGCNVGQGFLFGRPVPIEEFETSFGQRACA